MNIGSFRKQPVERIDYDIDFSEYLAGDTILASPAPTVAITPAGSLNQDVVAVMTGSKKVKVWLTGGTSGQTYKVEVTVNTTAGRVKQVEFRVRVKDD